MTNNLGEKEEGQSSEPALTAMGMDSMEKSEA